MAIKINVNAIPDNGIPSDKLVSGSIHVPTISTTHSALKALRDAGTLVPGQFYRITDYQCTVNSSITYATAASHLFDIIVFAVDASHLSEYAKAAHHAGDTYFANSNLDAWELKYCIDNDTARFHWAGKIDATITVSSTAYTRNYMYDGQGSVEGYTYAWINSSTVIYTNSTTPSVNDTAYNGSTAVTITAVTSESENGKGTVYYMKDEFFNEVPYDFKNVQFWRKWNITYGLWSTITTSAYGKACYTFSSEGISSTTVFTDLSLAGYTNNIYSNIIKEYSQNNKQKQYNNCFFGTNCYYNILKGNCYENTFGNYCYNNIFEEYCSGNVLENKCRDNTFGSYCVYNIFYSTCYNNKLMGSCKYNTFGNNCYSNVFMGSCCNNSIGGNSNHNTFNTDCNHNTFGVYCDHNRFGISCDYVSFGSNCSYNILENYCGNNTFGAGCDYNIFKNSSYNNTLGNYCSYNIFESNCIYNTFALNATGTAGAYFNHNKIESRASYNIFYNTDTASSSNAVQNYTIKSSMTGSYSSKNTIQATRNNTHDTTVAKNSSGVVKIYCEADLVA